MNIKIISLLNMAGSTKTRSKSNKKEEVKKKRSTSTKSPKVNAEEQSQLTTPKASK